MTCNNWKFINRKKQDKYWLHHTIKYELGNKKYDILLSQGKIKDLEKEICKGKTVYQLIKTV